MAETDAEVFLARLMADGKQLAEQAKIPYVMIEGLSADADWAFVIKCHAILEAAMNFALLKALIPSLGIFAVRNDQGNALLLDVIPKLPLEGKTGKLRLIKDHGLMGERTIETIRKFSELRNNYIYDIENLSKTLTNFVKEKDKKTSNSFTRHFVTVVD